LGYNQKGLMSAGNTKYNLFLVMLVLSLMTMPAYADGNKETAACAGQAKSCKRGIKAVDVYGDGTLMIATHSSDAEKTPTVAEALDALIPLPASARNLVVEQKPDGTIVIRSATAAHKSALQPVAGARAKKLDIKVTKSDGTR
jgi:hypothetical protein